MKKTLIALNCLAGLASIPAHADAIGVYLTAKGFSSQFDGNIGSDGDQANVNLSKKTQGTYSLALEHPLPFIPNVRVAYVQLETDGITDLATQLTIDGQTFSQSTKINTQLDTNFVDYTAYYEVLDNDTFGFDIGLTVRDTEVAIKANSLTSTPNISANEKASGYIPMLYAATRIEIPTTGITLVGTANLLAVGDHSFYDYQVGVQYAILDNAAVDWSVGIGYRSINIELNDLDNLTTDITFDGAYIGTELHF